MIYVGSTTEQLNKKFNEYMFDVKHKGSGSTELANNFTSISFEEDLKVYIFNKYSQSTALSVLKTYDDKLISQPGRINKMSGEFH